MSLTFDNIEFIAKKKGFVFHHQQGSHRVYYYDKKIPLVIPYHKEFAPKTAKSMLEVIAQIENLSHKDIIKEYNIKL